MKIEIKTSEKKTKTKQQQTNRQTNTIFREWLDIEKINIMAKRFPRIIQGCKVELGLSDQEK
jgi:hypothetical protein